MTSQHISASYLGKTIHHGSLGLRMRLGNDLGRCTSFLFDHLRNGSQVSTSGELARETVTKTLACNLWGTCFSMPSDRRWTQLPAATQDANNIFHKCHSLMSLWWNPKPMIAQGSRGAVFRLDPRTSSAPSAFGVSQFMARSESLAEKMPAEPGPNLPRWNLHAQLATGTHTHTHLYTLCFLHIHLCKSFSHLGMNCVYVNLHASQSTHLTPVPNTCIWKQTWQHVFLYVWVTMYMCVT